MMKKISWEEIKAVVGSWRVGNTEKLHADAENIG